MPLDTPLHFAHYKPWFMISVLEQLDPKAEAVFYFDPDITVPTRWSYYEEWAGYGVAMVEDNHYHVGPGSPAASRVEGVCAGKEYRSPPRSQAFCK